MLGYILQLQSFTVMKSIHLNYVNRVYKSGRLERLLAAEKALEGANFLPPLPISTTLYGLSVYRVVYLY